MSHYNECHASVERPARTFGDSSSSSYSSCQACRGAGSCGEAVAASSGNSELWPSPDWAVFHVGLVVAKPDRYTGSTCSAPECHVLQHHAAQLAEEASGSGQ